MNIINSKNYITSFILVIFLHVTCSDNPETNLPVLISEKTYNPETICDCNDDGINILNDILAKRKQFETFELLAANQRASEHINLLKKNWKTMQYKCLKLFGPALMRPEGCNQPQEIQSAKDQLHRLGVRT
tara:strand:- start:105 stop:497 length:393 start_codon:yes stop_codon:yes gene_type:complete